MLKKTFTILSILSVVSFTALTAQTTDDNDAMSAASNGTEQLRINPSDFNSALDILIKDWYVSNSFVIDCKGTGLMMIDSLTESEVICRLENISLGFTMPYNETVLSFIKSYLRRPRQIEYMLGLGETYYFPIFEAALERYQVPLELKYLPVIESALNPRAVSSAGATGLWQFMLATGRSYGLEVNTLVDERRDPLKSSEAAAHYLHDLYSMYGDWLLAIAAYNCGPGNVQRAIRNSGGKKTYWEIYNFLPRETRNYVPIFIAANYVMNYYQEHGMCPARPNFNTTVDTLMVNERVHLQQISEVLSVPLEELRFLNPQYRYDIVPGNVKSSSLVLPMSVIAAFEQNLDTIISYKAAELVSQNMKTTTGSTTTSSKSSSSSSGGHVIYHTVKSGETLSSIAKKYHTSVDKIKKLNKISGTMIRAGSRLKIYK